MREVTGNLWTYPADVRVITTNGTIKSNGECVMGRGCAAEAKQRWSFIASTIGRLIREHGNHVFDLEEFPAKWVEVVGGGSTPTEIHRIFTFPVKHHWFERADPALIERSAKELVEILSNRGMANITTVVLPRPGCGNGGLKWEDVKPVIAPILDDRFHVITWR